MGVYEGPGLEVLKHRLILYFGPEPGPFPVRSLHVYITWSDGKDSSQREAATFVSSVDSLPERSTARICSLLQIGAVAPTRRGIWRESSGGRFTPSEGRFRNLWAFPDEELRSGKMRFAFHLLLFPCCLLLGFRVFSALWWVFSVENGELMRDLLLYFDRFICFTAWWMNFYVLFF